MRRSLSCNNPAHGSKEMPIWGSIFYEIAFDHDLGNVAAGKYNQIF